MHGASGGRGPEIAGNLVSGARQTGIGRPHRVWTQQRGSGDALTLGESVFRGAKAPHLERAIGITTVRDQTLWLIAYRTLSDIIAKGAFFVVTVMAARRLSAEEFGVFALGSTMGWILAVASDFGMQLHLSRAVAQRPEGARRLLSGWLRIRVGTAAGALMLFALGLVLTGAGGAYGPAILLLAIVYALGGITEFLNYFYRGLARSDIESTLTVGQRLGTLACAAGALWWAPDVTSLALALLPPAALTAAYSLRRAWALSASGISGAADGRNTIAGSVGDVLPIGAGILLSALYFRVDLLLIEMWEGPAKVGQYNAVFRLIEALRLFPAAVVAVNLPVLFRATNPRPLVTTSTSVTLFGAGVGVVLWVIAAPLVGALYGSAFADAVPAFRILVLGFPLMCLNYVLTHQLIGWQGHRAYAVICLVALALNVGLNTRLIPALSILGAAWATVWTEVAITVGCTLALGRLVRVSRPAWRAALGRTGSR